LQMDNTYMRQAKDYIIFPLDVSSLEVKMIKETFGQDFIAVTPGIRPDWDMGGKNDQQRVTTPARAVKNGSDYLVIGRPIRNASNPKDAALRIAEEIETVL